MLVKKQKLEGYVRINETSYDKLTNYHLENGFIILSAFRSEFSLSQNRERTRKLKNDIKDAGFGFIPVVGGYREIIKSDNPNWDKADVVSGKDGECIFQTTEESVLVPNYDMKTKEPMSDFEVLRKLAIRLGQKYDQDTVLISPPNGKAHYVITSNRYASSVGSTIGAIDMQFDKMSLANIADAYFTSLAKTMNRLKHKSDGGVKFENKTYTGAYIREPLHTLSGAHSLTMNNELPMFGSHYMPSSTF